jgi:hypothetical protein
VIDLKTKPLASDKNLLAVLQECQKQIDRACIFIIKTSIAVLNQMVQSHLIVFENP